LFCGCKDIFCFFAKQIFLIFFILYAQGRLRKYNRISQCRKIHANERIGR